MTIEEISLAVATIAGWTEIEPWYSVNSYDQNLGEDAETPALALCKLLLAINPTPIAPPQVAIIVDDGETETVFEAEFV